MTTKNDCTKLTEIQKEMWESACEASKYDSARDGNDSYQQQLNEMKCESGIERRYMKKNRKSGLELRYLVVGCWWWLEACTSERQAKYEGKIEID